MKNLSTLWDAREFIVAQGVGGGADPGASYGDTGGWLSRPKQIGFARDGEVSIVWFRGVIATDQREARKKTPSEEMCPEVRLHFILPTLNQMQM